LSDTRLQRGSAPPLTPPTKADLQAVTTALAAMIGQPHPLAGLPRTSRDTLGAFACGSDRNEGDSRSHG
jgi:hypothetical protein